MPRPTARHEETVWRYLSEHRGEMFCAGCLGTAIGATGRLDRALFGAEGRGAVRRHGACSTCGKDRLVIGRP